MRNVADLLFLGNGSASHVALVHRDEAWTYERLRSEVSRLTGALLTHGVRRFDRVAILLDKRPEATALFLASVRAGAIVVPINPQLKPRQVAHILGDSGSRFLFTTRMRARAIEAAPLAQHEIVLCDTVGEELGATTYEAWAAAEPRPADVQVTDGDPAALLYTSGSTGLPKGVIVSHRNLIAGAESVNEYLGTCSDDVILGVLPLSFDAGLSQLTTALGAGARLVLHDYLLASEVARECDEQRVTCITAVPPLWSEIAEARWTDRARLGVRLIANTGGRMPPSLLSRLRALFPRAEPYLMYGLTEAFRSTFLNPREVDVRHGSVGKAVPNAEIHVLRPDGSECEDDEPGELVHRGACVTLGYWNDPERTALRFRPLPPAVVPLGRPEIAVWSGDLVRRDSEGFLYHIGRLDEQIKRSGFRVSPEEIEQALHRSSLVRECVVFGIPGAERGDEIVALVVPADASVGTAAVLSHCKRELPTFMVPTVVELVPRLGRNANGKLDRAGIKNEWSHGRRGEPTEELSRAPHPDACEPRTQGAVS